MICCALKTTKHLSSKSTSKSKIQSKNSTGTGCPIIKRNTNKTNNKKTEYCNLNKHYFHTNSNHGQKTSFIVKKDETANDMPPTVVEEQYKPSKQHHFMKHKKKHNEPQNNDDEKKYLHLIDEIVDQEAKEYKNEVSKSRHLEVEIENERNKEMERMRQWGKEANLELQNIIEMYNQRQQIQSLNHEKYLTMIDQQKEKDLQMEAAFQARSDMLEMNKKQFEVQKMKTLFSELEKIQTDEKIYLNECKSAIENDRQKTFDNIREVASERLQEIETLKQRMQKILEFKAQREKEHREFVETVRDPLRLQAISLAGTMQVLEAAADMRIFEKDQPAPPTVSVETDNQVISWDPLCHAKLRISK